SPASCAASPSHPPLLWQPRDLAGGCDRGHETRPKSSKTFQTVRPHGGGREEHRQTRRGGRKLAQRPAAGNARAAAPRAATACHSKEEPPCRASDTSP